MESESEDILLVKSFFFDYLNGSKIIKEIAEITGVNRAKIGATYDVMMEEMRKEHKKITSKKPSRTEIINDNLCIIYQSKMNYED